MYFFYRIVTAVGMILLAPYYAMRGWNRGEPWRTLRERLGSLPRDIILRATASVAPKGAAPGAIWIHAVSVSPDGTRVAAADMAGEVQIWALPGK